MAFTKSPAGATSNYTLTGTEGIDITSVPGSNSNVSIFGLGDADQVTVQSTDGTADGFLIEMGDGADRVFVDSDPNNNNSGSFYFVNSTIRGGAGDDILFGDERGVATNWRTGYFTDSLINGNQGQDLVRTYGLITSRVEGGQDGDTLEVLAVGFNGDNVTNLNPIPYSPDRYDGATVQGSRGNDTISVTLGRTNFVNSKINGNEDDDLITNNGIDVSGNWQNSTIYGGQGADTVAMQVGGAGGFVTSSLIVSGDLGSDLLLTGIGNDTVIGGTGWDTISVSGGINKIYGDNTDGSGSGNDSIVVNTAAPNTANLNNRTSQNTVWAGDGADIVTINTNGNNVVYGDASTAGGADTIRIYGTGNNSVEAGVGNDTVLILGGGSNTVYGATGNDTLDVGGGGNIAGVGSDIGRDAHIFGEDGADVIRVNITGQASLSGGLGNDSIAYFGAQFQTNSGVNEGGLGADTINLIDIGGRVVDNSSTYIQADGDSVAATAVTIAAVDNTWSNGDTIVFGNGVDYVIGVEQNLDLFDTTLGDLGLDSQIAGGELYAAFANAGQGGYAGRTVDLNAQSGMVAGRSYFMWGTFNTVTNTFTVSNLYSAGDDSLLITNGNNGPLTTNANVVVLEDFDASTLNFTNFN